MINILFDSRVNIEVLKIQNEEKKTNIFSDITPKHSGVNHHIASGSTNKWLRMKGRSEMPSRASATLS